MIINTGAMHSQVTVQEEIGFLKVFLLERSVLKQFIQGKCFLIDFMF